MYLFCNIIYKNDKSSHKNLGNDLAYLKSQQGVDPLIRQLVMHLTFDQFRSLSSDFHWRHNKDWWSGCNHVPIWFPEKVRKENALRTKRNWRFPSCKNLDIIVLSCYHIQYSLCKHLLARSIEKLPSKINIPKIGASICPVYGKASLARIRIPTTFSLLTVPSSLYYFSLLFSTRTTESFFTTWKMILPPKVQQVKNQTKY